MKTRIYATPAVKGLSSPQHQPQSTQDAGATLFYLGPQEYEQQSSYKYDKGLIFICRHLIFATMPSFSWCYRHFLIGGVSYETIAENK